MEIFRVHNVSQWPNLSHVAYYRELKGVDPRYRRAAIPKGRHGYG